MAAGVHAKVESGRKLWYVWGGRGEQQWEKPYPTVHSRGELYRALAAELGLPAGAPSIDVVLVLMTKTWTGSEWVDDFVTVD